jgi:hypothetical protein
MPIGLISLPDALALTLDLIGPRRLINQAPDHARHRTVLPLRLALHQRTRLRGQRNAHLFTLRHAKSPRSPTTV